MCQEDSTLVWMVCHSVLSPNYPVEEDNVDDWLNKTMSFAIILMNPWPSWASRLNAPYGPTQPSSYPPNWPIPYWPKTYLSCSVFLEDENAEVEDTPEIPHSGTAQHADNHLDAVQAILLDFLTPTELLESSVQSLIQYASKFFLMDGKLMHWDVQGHCHDLISPFYYISSSPLFSLLISSVQPFSQLYSCFYCIVGSVSQAIFVLLLFWFLILTCASIPPDLGWLIGTLCCGSHSFSPHLRGF